MPEKRDGSMITLGSPCAETGALSAASNPAATTSETREVRRMRRTMRSVMVTSQFGGEIRDRNYSPKRVAWGDRLSRVDTQPLVNSAVGEPRTTGVTVTQPELALGGAALIALLAAGGWAMTVRRSRTMWDDVGERRRETEETEKTEFHFRQSVDSVRIWDDLRRSRTMWDDIRRSRTNH